MFQPDDFIAGDRRMAVRCRVTVFSQALQRSRGGICQEDTDALRPEESRHARAAGPHDDITIDFRLSIKSAVEKRLIDLARFEVFAPDVPSVVNRWPDTVHDLVARNIRIVKIIGSLKA